MRAEPGARVAHVDVGVAFLTGRELGSRDLADVDASVFLRLRESAPESPNRYYRRDRQDHGSTFGGTAVLRCAPDLLQAAVNGWDGTAGWHPDRADLVIHEYGVGTATLRFVPTIERMPDETLAPDINALESAITPALDDVIVRVVAALNSNATPEPGSGVIVPLIQSGPDPGRILWAWVHIHAEARPDVDVAQQAALIADVHCPNSYKLLSHRDHAFAAGVAVSVTCSRPGCVDDGVALARVLAQQDAWWTLLWALDRSLLALQDDAPADTDRRSIAELKRRAATIDGVTVRVRMLQGRVDSALMSGGARELDAWRLLEDPWFLQVRTASVERKLAALDAGYCRVLDELARRRSDQISTMVYIFTAVSVIASAIAVVQYAQGAAPSDASTRYVVLGVAVLSAALAVLSTLRVRLIRRGRHDAGRGAS